MEPASLDAPDSTYNPASGTRPVSLGDAVDDPSPTTEELTLASMGAQARRDALERAVARLPERQRAMLVARYGFDGRSPGSLQVVSPIGWPSPARTSARSRSAPRTPSRAAADSPARADPRPQLGASPRECGLKRLNA